MQVTRDFRVSRNALHEGDGNGHHLTHYIGEFVHQRSSRVLLRSVCCFCSLTAAMRSLRSVLGYSCETNSRIEVLSRQVQGSF